MAVPVCNQLDELGWRRVEPLPEWLCAEEPAAARDVCDRSDPAEEAHLGILFLFNRTFTHAVFIDHLNRIECYAWDDRRHIRDADDPAFVMLAQLYEKGEL